MKVKAKWAVKVGGKWHKAGETFEVDDIKGLHDMVEVIAKEKPSKAKAEDINPETEESSEAVKTEPADNPKPATRTRRKTTEK